MIKRMKMNLEMMCTKRQILNNLLFGRYSSGFMN